MAANSKESKENESSEKEQEENIIKKLFSTLIPNTTAWSSVSLIENDIYLGGIPYPKSDFTHYKIQDEYNSPHAIISHFNIGSLISFSDYEVDWSISLRIEYLHYVFHDDPDFKIYEAFNRIILHIDQAREKKLNVFIHCHMGISRSVTCLAAYYLYRGLPGSTETPTTIDVIKFIQKARPIAMPNYGFFKQLLAFEQSIRKGEFVLNTKPDI